LRKRQSETLSGKSQGDERKRTIDDVPKRYRWCRKEKYTAARHEPWNKGKLIGQKPPLKLKEVWAIRIRLQIADNLRELALFNLAIDSKLRGCDLVSLRLNDVEQGGRVMPRAIIQQKKTGRPVQFEITPQSREAIKAWREGCGLRPGDYLFPSRMAHSPHLSTRQYARLVERWVSSIGLDPMVYGTHSMRRTKATLIYRQTKNLRAVQLLLGHTKLESTVRYLGIELEDALDIVEKLEV
jgi:integrase